jgi:hypothetical protein
MNQRPSILIVLALVFLAASAAHAQMPRDLHHHRIMKQLSSPVKQSTARDWRGLGPRLGTNEMLIGHVYNIDLSDLIRLRSIQALAFFSTKRSQQFLWQVVYDRFLTDDYKRMALTSLGGAFQETVMLELARFLKKESPSLRAGAISGLGLVRNSRARSILEGHLPDEADIDLRMSCERAIAQVAAWEKSEELGRLETLRGAQIPVIGEIP